MVLLLLVLIVDRGLAGLLLTGLKKYYSLNRDVDVVCIGHSRTVLGIDPDYFEEATGLRCAKYAFRGADANDRRVMLEHFLREAKSPPKTLLFEVSGFTFNEKGLSSNSYQLLLPFMDEPPISEYVTQRMKHAEGARYDIAVRRLLHLPRFDEGLIALAIRGFVGNRRNLKSNTLNPTLLQQRIQSQRAMLPKLPTSDSRARFDETIELALQHGMNVVLIYIPTVDVMNELDRPTHDAVVDNFSQLADGSDKITFLDYNSAMEHMHELFADGIHLNAKGQQRLTKILAEDIKDLTVNQ